MSARRDAPPLQCTDELHDEVRVRELFGGAEGSHEPGVSLDACPFNTQRERLRVLVLLTRSMSYPHHARIVNIGRNVLKRGWPLCIVSLTACGVGRAAPLRDGDIIFQKSKSAQSVAIQRATHSPYSHMGVILHRGAKPYVFEAFGTVRYTSLQSWISRGVDGRYVVKRVRPSVARVTPSVLKRARALVREMQGKPYDLTFEWSDTRIYCSELVWKLYERAMAIRIGELQKLRDFDLSDAAVRAKLRERYGDRVPLEEPVISPAAMFDSPLLEQVLER
jgi:hypothetical protein